MATSPTSTEWVFARGQSLKLRTERRGARHKQATPRTPKARAHVISRAMERLSECSCVEIVVLLCDAATVIVVVGTVGVLDLSSSFCSSSCYRCLWCCSSRAAGILWLLARQRNGRSRCATRTPHGTVTTGGNGACAGVLTWFDGDVYLGQFSKGEFHG